VNEERIEFAIDADNTLAEAWDDLAKVLAQTGAQDYQIGAMQMTYFMGAAQACSVVMANARGGRDEFDDAMEQLFKDIDRALPVKKQSRRRHV
jgi:hypothetical protein